MKKNINIETIINSRRIKGSIIFVVVILILLGIAGIFVFFVRGFDEDKYVAPTISEEDKIISAWTQNTMFLNNTLNLNEDTTNLGSAKKLTINNFTWIKSRPKSINDITKSGGEFYWNNNDSCIDLYLNFVSVDFKWRDGSTTPVTISILYSNNKALLEFTSQNGTYNVGEANPTPLPVFSSKTKSDWLDATKLYSNLTNYLSISFTSKDPTNPSDDKHQTAVFSFQQIPVPSDDTDSNYAHQLNHYLLHDLILNRLWFSDAALTTRKNVYGAPVNFVASASSKKAYYETKIRENVGDSGSPLLNETTTQSFSYLSQYIIAYNTWKYWNNIKYFSKAIT